jgi:hypothetical protein
MEQAAGHHGSGLGLSPVAAIALAHGHLRRPGRDGGLHQPPCPAARQAVTMLPALVILATGANATSALTLYQQFS